MSRRQCHRPANRTCWVNKMASPCLVQHQSCRVFAVSDDAVRGCGLGIRMCGCKAELTSPGLGLCRRWHSELPRWRPGDHRGRSIVLASAFQVEGVIGRWIGVVRVVQIVLVHVSVRIRCQWSRCTCRCFLPQVTFHLRPGLQFSISVIKLNTDMLLSISSEYRQSSGLLRGPSPVLSKKPGKLVRFACLSFYTTAINYFRSRYNAGMDFMPTNGADWQPINKRMPVIGSEMVMVGRGEEGRYLEAGLHG